MIPTQSPTEQLINKSSLYMVHVNLPYTDYCELLDWAAEAMAGRVSACYSFGGTIFYFKSSEDAMIFILACEAHQNPSLLGSLI